MSAVDHVSYNFLFLLAARVLQKGAPLILLPIYMQFLTPAQFGTYGLAVLLISSIGAFVNNFGSVPYGRFYVAENQSDRPALISSFLSIASTLYLLSACSVIIAASLAKDQLAHYGANLELLAWLVLAVLPVLVHSLLDAHCRITGRVKLMLAAELAWTTGMVGSGLYAVVHLKLELHGAIQALAIGPMGILIFAIYAVFTEGINWPRTDLLKAIVRFSWPLLPSAILVICRDAIPRAGSASWISLEFAGLVAVAGMIASVPGVVVSAYYASFGSSLLHKFQDQKFNDTHTEYHFIQGIYICILASLTTAFLAGPLIHEFAPTEYHGAAALVPWFAFAMSCRFFWLARSILIMHSGRSHFIPLINFAGLVAVIAFFYGVVVTGMHDFVGGALLAGFVVIFLIAGYCIRDYAFKIPMVSYAIFAFAIVVFLLSTWLGSVNSLSNLGIQAALLTTFIFAGGYVVLKHKRALQA